MSGSNQGNWRTRGGRNTSSAGGGGASQGDWRVRGGDRRSSAGGGGRSLADLSASAHTSGRYLSTGGGGASQGDWRTRVGRNTSSTGGGGRSLADLSANAHNKGRHQDAGGSGRSLVDLAAGAPHMGRRQSAAGDKPALATTTAQDHPRRGVHSLTTMVPLLSVLAHSGNNGHSKVSRPTPQVTVPYGDQIVKRVGPSATQVTMNSPTPTTSAATVVVYKAVEDGLKGSDLADKFKDPPTGTGGELLFYILTQPGAEEDYDCSWAADEQYGAALRVVLGEHMSASEQARGLFGAQRALAMHGFPKDVTALLENVWVKLYQDDLVDEDGFISWRDNDTHEKTTKNPALIQGGPFLIWLVESESSTDVSSDGE